MSDPTLLDTSDVELVEIKLLESDPVVVLRFNCQQINCSRDKFGNVTGAPQPHPPPPLPAAEGAPSRQLPLALPVQPEGGQQTSVAYGGWSKARVKGGVLGLRDGRRS